MFKSFLKHTVIAVATGFISIFAYNHRAEIKDKACSLIKKVKPVAEATDTPAE